MGSGRTKAREGKGGESFSAAAAQKYMFVLMRKGEGGLETLNKDRLILVF